MLPLLFISPSRDKISSSACQHSSAVKGGTHRSLTRTCAGLGALLRSHVHPSSVHPSQLRRLHISVTGISALRELSVKLPSDYSLHHRFSQLSNLMIFKKVSTGNTECQVPSSVVFCRISPADGSLPTVCQRSVSSSLRTEHISRTVHPRFPEPGNLC